MSASLHYDLQTVIAAASGRWLEIMQAKSGIASHFFLQTSEGPCPKCEGDTRWKVYPNFSENGGCRCNNCGNWSNGFKFLAWCLSMPKNEVVDMVGEYLRCEPKKSRRSKKTATKPPKTAAKNSAAEKPVKPTPARNDDREKLRLRINDLAALRIESMKVGEDFTKFEPEIQSLKKEYGSIDWLAKELGVTSESLDALGVTYDAKSNEWRNPEFDSQRKVIGTSRRLADGSKTSVWKSRRGLCYAEDWILQPGPVLLVEGMSDTAKGVSLRLAIIGRPGKDVPKPLKPELVAMLKDIPADRQIIVVAENDKQSDGTWPGREGAIATAKFLAADLKREILWGLPPEDVKDLRAWHIANPDKSGSDFVDSLKLETVNQSDTREPASEIDPKEDAEFFLQDECHHADGITLRFYRGSYWRWRNNRWSEVSADNVRAEVALYLGERYTKVSSRSISNVLEFVRALTIIQDATEMPCWLDSRAGYSIAFSNGIATLDDLILNKPECLRPHSPQWFSEVVLPYEFQPEASCETWMQVLITNLEADASRMDLVAEFVGYCLTKSTEYHSALALVGEGHNGKSVALAGITGILGKQNVSSLSLDELSEKFKSSRIVGKLANVCGDLSETTKVSEGVLKKMISGDALEFERKNQQPFSAIPTAKLIFATNTLPQFYDRSNGLWRRLIVMPFSRQVTETEKVTGMDQPEWWLKKDQLSGMFNWALAGIRQLRNNGAFTVSRVCQQALAVHKLECNHAATFLTDGFEVARHDDGRINETEKSISRQSLYEWFAAYCKMSGYKSLGVTAFGREVTKVFGPLDVERAIDLHRGPKARSRFYIGLRRIPEDKEKLRPQ